MPREEWKPDLDSFDEEKFLDQIRSRMSSDFQKKLREEGELIKSIFGKEETLSLAGKE